VRTHSDAYTHAHIASQTTSHSPFTCTHAVASRRLGNCYRNGEGVEKDLAESMRLYTLSAEAGFVGAQFALGMSYISGQGVRRIHIASHSNSITQ
jgi:TPR repeat protein